MYGAVVSSLSKRIVPNVNSIYQLFVTITKNVRYNGEINNKITLLFDNPNGFSGVQIWPIKINKYN